MITVFYDTDEEYPVYIVSEKPQSGLNPVEIPDEALEVVRAYNASRQAYYEAEAALVKVLIPHCPECGHEQSRHQEFSMGWAYWGCLVKVPGIGGGRTCRCQHGKPEGR